MAYFDYAREFIQIQNAERRALSLSFQRGVDSTRGVIMRKSLLISVTSLVALGLMFTPAFSAQAWETYKNNEKIKAQVLEKYDYNRNGVLDPEELKSLKEDNDAAIKRARERVLQRLEQQDLNNNGRLDPEEK